MHKSINIKLKVSTLTLQSIEYILHLCASVCVCVLICQRKIEEGSFDVTHNLHKHNAKRPGPFIQTLYFHV